MTFESATFHQRLSTRTCITFDNGDYSLSYSNVTRVAVHSTSWKFSTLWKSTQHITYIFRTTTFFIKFWNPNQIFKHFNNFCVCANRVYVSLHTIYRFPIIIWNWNLHWRCPFINKFGQYSINLVTQIFRKRILVCKLRTVILQNLLCPIFSFIACMGFDILSKELYTRKYFQEKLCVYVHDFIYKLFSSKTIHNVHFQLIICQKICKKYALTSHFEDINNMLTELTQSGMQMRTAIEALQLVKSRWEIKGAFLKISSLPYFTSNYKLLMRFFMHKIN